MSGLVIDASVAVKWFLAEDRSAEAQRLRELSLDLIAPESIVFEVFHALWDAARTGRIPRDRLDEAATIVPKPFAFLAPMGQLFLPAAGLARSLSHPVYDCAYLALAQRENAEIVTADEGMLRAARRGRIKARLL